MESIHHDQGVMHIKIKFFSARIVVTLILTSISLPAHASLIKYDFFNFLFSEDYGSAYAGGMLTYDTFQETLIDGMITTTASRDMNGMLTCPGRLHIRLIGLAWPTEINCRSASCPMIQAVSDVSAIALENSIPPAIFRSHVETAENFGFKLSR